MIAIVHYDPPWMPSKEPISSVKVLNLRNYHDISKRVPQIIIMITFILGYDIDSHNWLDFGYSDYHQGLASTTTWYDMI